MEKMKLIICGNGFDLHHGLKTNYLSYKKYLEDSHSEILSELEDVRNSLDFSVTESDFWYDVEGNLSDIYNHTFFHYDENSMDRLINITYQFTGGAFLEWLCHVYKQGKEKIKMCDKFSEIMSNSLFINFNYTQTLEEIYSVNKENILYIHGSIASVIKNQFELGNNSNMLDDNLTHNIIEFGASDIKLNPVIDSLSNENTEKKISFYTSPTKHLKGKIENIKKFIKNKEIA